MKLTVKISIVEEQLETIQAKRTGEISRLKDLKKQLKQLKQKQKLIKMKNQKEIARQILEQDNMETVHVKIANEHLEHIQKAAAVMGLSIHEAASFLLYCYLNDVQLAARIEQQKINN